MALGRIAREFEFAVAVAAAVVVVVVMEGEDVDAVIAVGRNLAVDWYCFAYLNIVLYVRNSMRQLKNA